MDVNTSVSDVLKYGKTGLIGVSNNVVELPHVSLWLLFSLFSLMDSHNSTNVCVIHLGILNVIDDLAPIEFKMA